MTFSARILALCLATSLWTNADARSSQVPPETTAPVDLVIALDVSGSMDGLIDSAKQRLWDIVNELGTAQPRPRLRVAIITFGNPNYGAQSGYVRIDQAFSTDLDLTNKTLFSFQTDGGDEYVARAVHTALNQLDWSADANALRVMFVAGNEAATQDPQFNLQQVAQAAMQRGIAVNAIYCGDEQDADATGWREVARFTDGFYASINQQAAAVANVSTPMDAQLAELNRDLNETYLPFGADGQRGRSNQLEQDEAVAELSKPAMASRAITKSSGLYSSSQWDLVDAVKDGKKLADVPVDALPEPMQALGASEREAFVVAAAEKREAVQARIQAIGKERQSYIETKRAESADTEVGLDDAMKQGLRRIAESRGYEFAE
jgi:hypothetical protein